MLSISHVLSPFVLLVALLLKERSRKETACYHNGDCAPRKHPSEQCRATQCLFLKDLPAHVRVGPMPPGALLATDLPLKDLDAQSQNIKHFVDLVLDIPKDFIEVAALQAILRDQAWEELPEVMKPKVRPIFNTIAQYFLPPQGDNHLVLLKHVHIVDDKVPGHSIQSLLRGSGKEIASAIRTRNWSERLASGCLNSWKPCSSESTLSPLKKRKTASSAILHEDDGWQFIQEHGELDKSDLKQLKWIHHHINLEGCPIHGWQERLVQKALDSLANESTCAKLCQSQRYDLTIAGFEPEVGDIGEKVVASR